MSVDGSIVRLGTETLAVNEAVPNLGAAERRKVESWLAALIQTEHLALLIGNGISSAVGHLIGTYPPSMAQHVSAGDDTQMIQAHAQASASQLGRDANLEDEIRSALDLLQGLTVLQEAERAEQVRLAIDEAMTGLLGDVLAFEKALGLALYDRTDPALDFERLVGRFLLPFASRPTQRDRLHLYTTNYDRVLEVAADRLGLRFLDRFVGSLEPRFSASRIDVDLHFAPPGVRGEPRLLDGVVRFAKLHGSVDWSAGRGKIVRSPLPLGADQDHPMFPTEPSSTAVIYPNPAKDVETLAYPYSELFRDFAAAVCRPNNVLVTFGYGFGDSHINRVIADMLTIPSTHLVVISRDPLTTLDTFRRASNYPPGQTSELIGATVGGLQEFVDLMPMTLTSPLYEAQAAYLDKVGNYEQAKAGATTGNEAAP